MTKLDTLRNWVRSAQRIVFFGGAGVSTESGIPDFRSQDGLYNQNYDFPPETILSASFFDTYPEEFYRFYHNNNLRLCCKDLLLSFFSTRHLPKRFSAQLQHPTLRQPFSLPQHQPWEDPLSMCREQHKRGL